MLRKPNDREVGPRQYAVAGFLTPRFAILFRMDIERIIHEIEQIEEMFENPDIRPFREADISAANRRHDEALASSPWFRLWKSYGVCCRTEAPRFQLPR